MTRRKEYKPVEVLLFFCDPETSEVITEKRFTATKIADIKNENLMTAFKIARQRVK